MAALYGIGAPSPGLWQYRFGTPKCSSYGRIRKREKARSQIRDR